MNPVIVLVPFLAALAYISFSRGTRYARYAALAGSLVSLALLPFIAYGSYDIQWLRTGGYSFPIALAVTQLNYMLLAVVLSITPIILLFSSGFMDIVTEQKRFYIEMLAFSIAMIAFSLSGNFITLFIAWEFLSLTSYLLIGFWHSKERANRAARKAITIVLMGDLALIGAIAIFWNAAGSLQFSAIIAAAGSGNPMIYAGTLMLLMAVLTKSAQFPFYDWLPDAMEGPTPVSAYLHSTTMVKAGVFAVAVLLPLFASTGISAVLLTLAILTAVIATYYAIVETHVKRIIAYSTVQELSLMIIALCANAVLAGIYFFFVQSFYKALLFFSAGSGMKATGKEHIDDVTGIRSSKLIYITTLFGVLSLAGFFPFSGFFAGAGLASSLRANVPIYLIISLISIATSFYIFRWVFRISGQPKNKSIGIAYAALPAQMKLAMAVLAAMTLAASLFFFYMPSFFSGYLPAYTSNGLSAGAADALVLMVLAVIGAALSYYVNIARRRKTKEQEMHARKGTVADAFYIKFSSFAYYLSAGATLIDTHISDFFDAFGRAAMDTGKLFRRFSVGEINAYALVVVASLLLLFAYAYVVLR
ncbi:MAG: NADH-quinone oxidoreductase subunit L [Candidatus Micrarchaeota archaeon]|nr:NADH-quinone oxidoreductase subunit L [Candidatus Micrarchaeota archaeon]